MKDAIARAQAASRKARRQRDNWKRRAEEAEGEAAARSEQLADVVRVLKQIDEAAKAGKEAK